MINLVPPAAKKTMRREYWLRVVSVWLLLLSGTLLLLIGAMAPSYVLIEGQLSVLASEMKAGAAGTESIRESEDSINIANQTANQLLADVVSPSFREVIALFEAYAPNTIQIQNIQISRADGRYGTISLSGIAASRGTLNTYHTQLLSDDLVEDAVLPIQNLAKNRDIPFTITIELAGQKAVEAVVNQPS